MSRASDILSDRLTLEAAIKAGIHPARWQLLEHYRKRVKAHPYYRLVVRLLGSPKAPKRRGRPKVQSLAAALATKERPENTKLADWLLAQGDVIDTYVAKKWVRPTKLKKAGRPEIVVTPSLWKQRALLLRVSDNLMHDGRSREDADKFVAETVATNRRNIGPLHLVKRIEPSDLKRWRTAMRKQRKSLHK